MPKAPFSPTYRSFLLRCWQEQAPNAAETMLWRFSLCEVAEIPQAQNFTTPEQLIDFLLAKLEKE